MINLSYSNKPLKLNPGILSTHTMNKNNLFIIEINKDMKDLLILKSIVDGYNINLCGKFSKTDVEDDLSVCDFSSDQKKVSIYINESQLTKECNLNNEPCYFQMEVKGNQDQKYTIGYTYNDHPFQMVKGLVINGPQIMKFGHKINFIYHVVPDSPVGIYFNSKGVKLNIYAKMVKGDHFDDKLLINFPSAANFDNDNMNKRGYVTNYMYDA